MSQLTQVKRALERGERITPLKALRNFGCLRLAHIIWVLRHKHGMNIATGERTQKGKTFAEYHLEGIELKGPGRPKSDAA